MRRMLVSVVSGRATGSEESPPPVNVPSGNMNHLSISRREPGSTAAAVTASVGLWSTTLGWAASGSTFPPWTKDTKPPAVTVQLSRRSQPRASDAVVTR